jgi:hypothetical protein
MAEPPGDLPPNAPEPTAWGGAGIDQYVESTIDRFTSDVITSALIAAGHDPAAVSDAIRRVGVRRETAPTRARARRVILIAYGVTYLVLVVGLILGPFGYGAGPIAAGIMTVVLGIAVALALWMVRRPGAPMAFGTLLAGPIVLLVLVGGTCAATTGTPFLWLGRLLGIVAY